MNELVFTCCVCPHLIGLETTITDSAFLLKKGVHADLEVVFCKTGIQNSSPKKFDLKFYWSFLAGGVKFDHNPPPYSYCPKERPNVSEVAKFIDTGVELSKLVGQDAVLKLHELQILQQIGIQRQHSI